MRILVTDGDTRQALAATRSLGRSGHVVVTIAERTPCLAGRSRYCAHSHHAPSPLRNSVGFVEAVAEVARHQLIDVVLPMTEASTLLLIEHRRLLPQKCVVPFPPLESVRRASDKASVLDLARGLGVPFPSTRRVTARSEIENALDDLEYPVVVKPARSRVQTASAWLSNSVEYATDDGDLRRRLMDLAEESYPVLLQERIRGPGIGVFMLFDAGHCVAQFAHRRIREKPPSGGVSVLCESIPVDPLASVHAQSLLASLNWHGPAMVEFKRDLRDGSLRLMEINGRFWGSLQLAVDAGVDFPGLLVSIASGSKPVIMPEYQIGVRCRWLAGDLDSLLLTMFKSRKSLNLPPGYPGRLPCLRDFLRFRASCERLELERRDDPRPALLEWRRKLLAR